MVTVKGGDMSRKKPLAYEVYILVLVMEGASKMIGAFPPSEKKIKNYAL